MMLLGNMYLHKSLVKKFNCIDCSCVFKDGLYCLLIYPTSEIFLLNLLLRTTLTTMKRGLNLIILNTALHQLNVAFASQHQKKWSNLCKHQTAKTIESKPHYIKNTVYTELFFISIINRWIYCIIIWTWSPYSY